MKRCQMYRKVRKTKYFNHVNRNIVYPTIFFNPNLEEGSKNTVEITELNTDEDVSETEHQDYNKNHSWCNITSDRSLEQGDDYTNNVNRSARDERQQNNENKKCENFIRSRKYNEDVLNQFCTDFYGIDCYNRGESISTVNNLYSEFFTSIKNQRSSETSSDSNQYDDIEVIQCDETEENDYWNSHNFHEHSNVTYDYDDNAEKRTILIDALTYKHYLSESDYELINIPSKDSISTTDEEKPSKDIPSEDITRIATPIPTYIPRIIFPLSPSMSTVTEVTEPKKEASNNSDINTENADKILFQRPLTGWFKDEIIKTQNIRNNASNMEKGYEKNWQALLPRERRRLRQFKIKEQNTLNTEKDLVTPVYCEPIVVIRNKEFSPESLIESFNKQIDEIESYEDNQANGINDETEVSLDSSRDDSTVNESLCKLQKPQINVSSEIKTFKKDITDSIEILDGNWIGQSMPDNDELLEVNDYFMGPQDKGAQIASQRTGSAIEECPGDRLLIRNMSLFNPAEWTHLPLAGNVPSFHLSISGDTDFDSEKKSWLKRFLHIVNCCK